MYNAEGSFARKHLEKHGWKEGSGLGSSQQGINQAIRVKIKHDTTGVGHNPAKEFTDHWWDHVFNKAAASLIVENGEDGVVVKKKIIAQKERSETAKKTLYSNFVKSSVLSEGTETRMEKEGGDSDGSEDEIKNRVHTLLLPDDELLKICGGRTAHKGARHGLKLNGKLARLQEQEQLLAASGWGMGKNHNSSPFPQPSPSPNRTREPPHPVECPPSETTPQQPKKRSKKRKRKEEEEEECAESDKVIATTQIRAIGEMGAPPDQAEDVSCSVSKRKKKKRKKSERAEKESEEEEEKEERKGGEVGEKNGATVVESSFTSGVTQEGASRIESENETNGNLERRKEKKKRKKERREIESEVEREKKAEENEREKNVTSEGGFSCPDTREDESREKSEETSGGRRKEEKKKRKKGKTENGCGEKTKEKKKKENKIDEENGAFVDSRSLCSVAEDKASEVKKRKKSKTKAVDGHSDDSCSIPQTKTPHEEVCLEEEPEEKRKKSTKRTSKSVD